MHDVIVREKQATTGLKRGRSVRNRTKVVAKKQSKELAQKLAGLSNKMDTILDLLNSVVGAVVDG